MAETLRQQVAVIRAWSEAHGLSQAESEALLVRIEAACAPKPRRRLAVLVLAPAAAIALFALAFWPADPWVHVDRGGACARVQDDRVIVSDACAEPVLVRLARDGVTLSPRSVLRRLGTGVELSGRARFVVAKRGTQEPPFTLSVSGGVIRVLGTVFEVESAPSQGVVRLREGRIAFVPNDGSAEVVLAPGESYAWPKRVESTLPLPKAPVQELEPRPQPGLSLRAALDRLFVLRTQRRWTEARAHLETLLARGELGRDDRRALSRELGLVIQAAGDETAACRHWQTHLRAFPEDESLKGMRADCGAAR